MGCLSISNCVNNLVKKYKTNDPFIIAEYMGIVIKYKNLNNLKGFYTYILRNGYIVINENLDEISKKIICAHELAHHNLHRGSGKKIFEDENCVSYAKSAQEIEANSFTAELIISDEDFFSLASNSFTCDEMAFKLKVHSELIIIKAQILNSKGYNFNIPYLKSANYL